MGDEVERTTGGVFDDPLATRINEKYREVEGLARSTLKAAIELGGMLQEKKSALPHGEWGRWVKAYFEGSERQAQRYMQVYAARDKLLANPSRVSDMSLREGLRAISPRQKEDQKEDREDSTKKLERKLKDAGFNRRFAAGLAQGLVQGALTRERVEGPLRWAGAEVGEEHTEPPEPGVIEQAEERGLEVPEIPQGPTPPEQAYIAMTELAILSKRVPPVEAARAHPSSAVAAQLENLETFAHWAKLFVEECYLYTEEAGSARADK